jgi:hypothetical protein
MINIKDIPFDELGIFSGCHPNKFFNLFFHAICPPNTDFYVFPKCKIIGVNGTHLSPAKVINDLEANRSITYQCRRLYYNNSDIVLFCCSEYKDQNRYITFAVRFNYKDLLDDKEIEIRYYSDPQLKQLEKEMGL